MLNISSQTITLIIGAQNWSAWIESISIGYGEYEVGSGLMQATGTINLVFPSTYQGLPSNPEYRFNASQWRRGQLIQIHANGSPLPCSGLALKILKPPQRPNKNANGVSTMSLSVGCALAYEYFPPEPNDDFSGITAGTPRSRGDIINSVLTTLRITCSVSIGLPINYPLPKIEGNWLDFCGQLADSAGYYLRCNTNGTVIAERILDNGFAATYIIGTDESDWTAIGDVSEQPIEKLIISGVKKVLEPFDPETETTVQTETAPLGELLPDVTWSNPLQLTTKKRTTKTKTKTLNTNIETETIEEPSGVILPDVGWSNPANLITSKVTTTTTTFLNGFISQVVEKIEEPLGVILPNVGWSNPANLSSSQETTKTWEKTGDQEYEQTATIRKPLGVILPDVNWSNPAQLSTASETVTQDAPPTDQPVSDYNLKEQQITSEVYATQLAASDGRERQRTISVPYADSIAQLSAYGEMFNRFLVGRAFGWRFATRLNTSLLPMQLVQIVDGSIGYLLRTDALQWAMNQTEAYLVFNGIEVGIFNLATPEDVVYPVSFPINPVSVRLINENYGERFSIEINAVLINENYGQYNDQIIVSRLINANYAERDNAIFSRLINANYGEIFVIRSRLINANYGERNNAVFSRLINSNFAQRNNAVFARLINTNYAERNIKIYSRLINANYGVTAGDWDSLVDWDNLVSWDSL